MATGGQNWEQLVFLQRGGAAMQAAMQNGASARAKTRVAKGSGGAGDEGVLRRAAEGHQSAATEGQVAHLGQPSLLTRSHSAINSRWWVGQSSLGPDLMLGVSYTIYLKILHVRCVS